MESERPAGFATRAFALVGKIGIVLGAVWVFIQLCRFFWPDAASIHGAVVATDFAAPPDLIEQITKLRNLKTYPAAETFLKGNNPGLAAPAASAFFSLLTEHLGKSEKESDSQARLTAVQMWTSISDDPAKLAPLEDALRGRLTGFLVKYAEEGWSKDYQWSDPTYRGYFVVNLANTGSKQATALELSSPYAGMASLERPGAAPVVTKFDHSISIGALLPDQSVIVRFWSQESPSEWQNDKCKIAFAEGIGSISLHPSFWEALMVWLRRHLWLIPAVGVLLALLPPLLHFVRHQLQRGH